MKINDLASDDAILTEFGQRIAKHRIAAQLTQAQVADQAGISKRTLERIESGEAAQMSNVIRIFRVLGLLSVLEGLIPEQKPSPMDLLKLKGKTRQRVSTRKPPEGDKKWSWDEGK